MFAIVQERQLKFVYVLVSNNLNSIKPAHWTVVTTLFQSSDSVWKNQGSTANTIIERLSWNNTHLGIEQKTLQGFLYAIYEKGSSDVHEGV